MRIPFFTAYRERQANELNERVTDALNVLDGPDSSDVAAFLQGMAIGGHTHQSEHCPIANYLHHEGFPWVTVDPHRVKIYTKDFKRRITLVVPPRSVRDFIREFDQGEYPTLEET